MAILVAPQGSSPLSYRFVYPFSIRQLDKETLKAFHVYSKTTIDDISLKCSISIKSFG